MAQQRADAYLGENVLSCTGDAVTCTKVLKGGANQDSPDTQVSALNAAAPVAELLGCGCSHYRYQAPIASG